MTHAILQHLWQSTLFALGAGLLTLAFRSNSARVRYGLWLAASLKFLIPFSVLTLLGSQLVWRSASSVPILSPSVVTVARQLAAPLATPVIAIREPVLNAFPLTQVLLAIWAAGCVFLLIRWGMRWLHVAAMTRAASIVTIEAPIEIRSSPMLSEPGVVGIFRPVLLLPAGIAERLTPEQMRSVIAHELCHVQRRDNLMAALHMLLEAVFWFHPLIWWIGARLVEERERACDEGVLARGNDPHTYAESILKVCQFYTESRLACVAGVSGADLKQRIEVIMRNRDSSELSVVKRILLLGAAAAVIAVPIAAGLSISGRASADTAGESAGGAVFDSTTVTAGSKETTMWLNVTQGKVSALRLPVRALIAFANATDSSRVVGGPAWIDQQLYDVTGTALHDTAVTPESPKRFQQMMQNLLTTRFAVRTHHETQPLDVYALRVAETGAKIRPMPSESLPSPNYQGQVMMQRNALMVAGGEISIFTGILSHTMGRPVVDQTGLKGRFSFSVVGDLTAAALPGDLHDQLGLTLEQTQAPVDVIVVDDAQPPVLDAPPAPATASTH